MKSLSRKGHGRPTPHMNVTPLVDVVLVLLIIFMIVIPAMEQGLDVEVPGVTNVDEAREDEADPFLLTVTPDGHLFFENTPLDEHALEDFLRRANRREPHRKLVLRGDEQARYADVRRLLAVVQNIGFPGVSLRVNQRQTDEGRVARN